jgi:hypothetical protein
MFPDSEVTTVHEAPSDYPAARKAKYGGDHRGSAAALTDDLGR